MSDILVQQILDAHLQRITFANYMDTVLYHPQYGYYSKQNLDIGKQGDFFTSVSLGKDFGELLAIAFYDMWQILECPYEFTLVEMGAGTGLLAKDILEYIKDNYLDFYACLHYIIIERSPNLVLTQKGKWEKIQHRISWQSWEDLTDNSLIGCIFSNELVDAFPVHQVIVQEQQLKEVYVGYVEGRFIERIEEISTEELKDYFELMEIDLMGGKYPEGYRTEVNLIAKEWLNTMARKLYQGYTLTIDYGYYAPKYYHPQRHQGTLQCYYQHKHHNNPYVNIGEQDITTHVNFTAIEKWGELLGLKKVGYLPQALFLMGLGLGDRLANLATTSGNILQLLSRRDALHQLIHPAGLGGFGVLLQGKKLDTLKALRCLKGF